MKARTEHGDGINDNAVSRSLEDSHLDGCTLVANDKRISSATQALLEIKRKRKYS